MVPIISQWAISSVPTSQQEMMQNGIWADKHPVMGLFLHEIRTKDQVRKYDHLTNRYAFDDALSVATSHAETIIRLYAANASAKAPSP
ncbi:MAG: hypothetical protein IJN00_07150 [Clostridia bacterium]|nr:hypothetical protein [Clostridia bacterium]